MATALHPPLSRTSRVAQLDSSLLDAELANILSAPVLSTLSNRLRSNYAHELALLLKFALLHIALKRDGATYGAKLQNLVFATDFRTNRDTRRRWLYVLLATLPEYLHARLRDYMLVHGWPDYPAPRSAIATLANSLAGRTAARTKRELKRLAWDCLARLEKLWSFLKLANFLAFLYDARWVWAGSERAQESRLQDGPGLPFCVELPGHRLETVLTLEREPSHTPSPPLLSTNPDTLPS